MLRRGASGGAGSAEFPALLLAAFLLFLGFEVDACRFEHSRDHVHVVRPDQVQQVTDQVRSHVLGAVVSARPSLWSPTYWSSA